jgi:hypothetical protein
LGTVIAVLSEELFEVSCGVIEGALIGGSSGTLPALTEAPFFSQALSDEGRTTWREKRGRRTRGGDPARPLVGVSKEFYSHFDVIGCF